MSVTWSDPDFALVVRVVGSQAGLDFMPERQSGVENGIRRAMLRANIDSLADYSRVVATDEQRLKDLIGELTVGETYFFREPAHFQFIREVLVPEYNLPINADRTIRVWSAGCSSGEEPYSLAMLFDEMGMRNRLFLLGTDLSPIALEKARRATYSEWSFRGESGRLAHRYVTRLSKDYQVVEAIRNRVNFSSLNLASDSYPVLGSGPSTMDLIFCRNVLIYFDRETVRGVARRLYESLKVGGWLITASCDPTLSEYAPLEAVVTAYGVFYRRAETSAFVSPPRHVSPSPRRQLQSTVTKRVAITSPPPRKALAPSPSSPSPAAKQRQEMLESAKEALTRGEYQRVVDLTGPAQESAEACVLNVKALANLNADRAEKACAEFLIRFPLSAELGYLHSVLLADLGRIEEACVSVRRVICLDRTLAIPHFFLGGLLGRRGDRDGARRCYRNAQELCMARPPGEELPLSDGEHAGALGEAARLQFERLA